jgi:magnesium-protoporphyrin O-methyltransferase
MSPSPVQRYFEGRGFSRWRRVYVEAGGSFFERQIRRGHAETIATVLSWLGAERGLAGTTVCDAGCGAGSLSIPLAQAGASVHAVDFSTKMIDLLRARAASSPAVGGRLRAEVLDLTALSDRYDVVVCLDVFARYPLQEVLSMMGRLSALSRSRLIVGFTPRTPLDRVLLGVGRAVARRAGAPPLYTHREDVIVRAMAARGRTLRRRAAIATPLRFYFSTLLELA